MEKTLLELYEIVLNDFENEKKYLYICNCAGYCLSREDYKRFYEHFFSQQPNETQYVEFFNEPCFTKANDSLDSWFKYENSKMGFESEPYKLRVKLLKAIIEKLKQ